MTLSDQLIEYLRVNHEWHHKGTLLRMEWRNKNGTLYMSETVGRTLRTLESERRVAVKDDDNGKSVVYKWLPPERRASYVPWSDRSDKRVLFTKEPQPKLL